MKVLVAYASKYGATRGSPSASSIDWVPPGSRRKHSR